MGFRVKFFDKSFNETVLVLGIYVGAFGSDFAWFGESFTGN